MATAAGRPGPVLARRPVHFTISIHTTLVGPPARSIPALRLDLDERALGCTAFDVVGRLLDGAPRIAVNEGRAREGALLINPLALRADDVAPLVARLREVLGGSG